jgi:hypothetical protein
MPVPASAETPPVRAASGSKKVNLSRLSGAVSVVKAVAQAPYSPKAEEIISRVGREVAEISLKFISWSAMIGALQFAQIKSGNENLWLLIFLAKVMLWMFIYCNISRLEIALFRPTIRPQSLRLRIVLMSLNLVVAQGLFMIAFFISDSVIKAIIDLQTR